MDVDRAIAIIETILSPNALIPVQIEIIRGTISGKSYQEIIAETKKTDIVYLQEYKLSYLKETGGRLWQSLSVKLDRKVTKTNLLAILLWYTKQSELNLVGQICADSETTTQIDWGERNQRGVDNRSFYGRETELETLTNWCLIDRCRLISVLGMGGIGKSSLIEKLVISLKANFDFVIWRSLLNAPPVIDVFGELLQFLTPLPQLIPTSVEGQIELLITYFTRNRCLVVLDNVESILQAQVHSGQYLQGYEGYGQIFRAIGELNHQSCLLLTSREKPATIARSAVIYPQLVKSLAVGGLTNNSAKKFIRSCGCPPMPLQWWKEIYTHYNGNPFALKIVAITAAEIILDRNTIAEFYRLMHKGKFQFRTIDDILQRQFDRLSPVEQNLVYWLAIEREPVTRKELCLNLFSPQTETYSTFDALVSLSRRCLAVRQQETWSIEPVMIAYATERLIDRLTRELGSELVEVGLIDLAQRFFHLNTYAIVKPQAKDYLRRAMVQLILRPILDRLLKIWQTPVALIQHLKNILAGWQSQQPIPLGYLAENILNLLIELADRAFRQNRSR